VVLCCCAVYGGPQLKPSNLLRREVIGGELRMLYFSVLFLPAIMLLLDLPWLQCLCWRLLCRSPARYWRQSAGSQARAAGSTVSGDWCLGDSGHDRLAGLMSLAAGDLPSPWALLVFTVCRS
jgi:hypothetical protein